MARTYNSSDYTVSQTRLLRALGFTWEQVASDLGYSSVASLQRTLRRAGWKVP